MATQTMTAAASEFVTGVAMEVSPDGQTVMHRFDDSSLTIEQVIDDRPVTIVLDAGLVAQLKHLLNGEVETNG